MAVAIQQISPVAHLPLVLGVVRKLNVAALIDTFCPPHPAHVLSCGRGVEALVLAILDGHHALYKVGARLEERGMLPLLQPGLKRASLHDYRLGQILDALFAAQLNRVFGAIALNALEVYALATPWLHQDTTTITLYGTYEEEARLREGLVPPRPAYGHSKDGRDDLKQVLLSLGVSSDGLPLRLGVRDGNTSDSTETPRALEPMFKGYGSFALFMPCQPPHTRCGRDRVHHTPSGDSPARHTPDGSLCSPGIIAPLQLEKTRTTRRSPSG
jgi:transposase